MIEMAISIITIIGHRLLHAEDRFSGWYDIWSVTLLYPENWCSASSLTTFWHALVHQKTEVMLTAGEAGLASITLHQMLQQTKPIFRYCRIYTCTWDLLTIGCSNFTSMLCTFSWIALKQFESEISSFTLHAWKYLLFAKLHNKTL